MLKVDGVDLANGTDVDTLNNGLFPSAAGTHTLTILDAGATACKSSTDVAAHSDVIISLVLDGAQTDMPMFAGIVTVHKEE